MTYFNNQYNSSGISASTNFQGPLLQSGVRSIEITDTMLKYFGHEVQKKIGAEAIQNRSPMTYVIIALLVICWILLTVLLLFRVARRSASNNKIINMLLNNVLVRTIRQIPLSIHFLILLVLSSILSTLSNNLTLFAVGFLGVLIIYYSLKTFKTCKQWPLLVAGIILVAYALLESNLLESMVSINSAMIRNLMTYSSLVATILILINLFVYRPKCNFDDLKGEGELSNIFELKKTQ